MWHLGKTNTKLNNENYETWKFKIELLLIKEGLWNIVNEIKPERPNEDWIEKDGQVKATIGLTVEN